MTTRELKKALVGRWFRIEGDNLSAKLKDNKSKICDLKSQNKDMYYFTYLIASTKLLVTGTISKSDMNKLALNGWCDTYGGCKYVIVNECELNDKIEDYESTDVNKA